MLDNNALTYSREEIRKKILETLDKIFSNRNLFLDRDNSSYLIFLSNLISALSADVLYNQQFLFGESNLITALLPSSVQNWATYIDYTPAFGMAAKTTLTFYFPLDNTFSAEIIPFQHYFYFGDIRFTPIRTIRIVNANNQMEVREVIDEQNNIYRIIPSRIILRDDGKQVLTFNIEVYNIFRKTFTFKLPALRPFEFYDIPIVLSDNEHLVGSSVKVGNEKWERGILVLATGNDKIYDVYVGSTQNQIIIRFGNGIYGKQPDASDVTIDLYLCNGSRANVQPMVIVAGDPIYTTNNDVVTYEVVNPLKADGGKDNETLLDVKRNAILNLRLRYRNVSYYDYEDDLPLTYPEIYADSRVVLFRADNFTNDVYVYLTLYGKNGSIIPSSTISFTRNILPSSIVLAYNTVLTSIAPFDSNIQYYSPFTIIPDDHRGIWKAYESFDTDRRLLLKENYYRNPPYPTTFSFDYNKVLLYKINFNTNQISFKADFQGVQVQDPNYKLVAVLVIRKKNGSTDTYSVTLANGQIQINHPFNSITDVEDINLVELQIHLEHVPTLNRMLIAAYSSVFNPLEQYITYGPLYRLNNVVYYVAVPVVEKNYYDGLSDEDKEYLNNIILAAIKRLVYEEDRRLFNTLPFIRFNRTVGKIYNLNYSQENYTVKGIVYSQSQAASFPNLIIGDKLLISDPISSADPWNPHAGKIAVYVDDINNNRVFQFIEVPQGSTARIEGDPELYVLVDTRWMRFNDDLPLKIEVEIYVDNPDIIGLEDKYKKIIVDYVNSLRPDTSFRFSELISRLHKVNGTRMVRFIKPKYDLVYEFDHKAVLQKLDKMRFISFVPEKLYTNYENVKIYLKRI